MNQPTAWFQGLSTPRLCVRRFAEPDIPSLVAYHNDPVSMHFQGWPAMSEEGARRFVAEMLDAQPGVAGEWFQFALEERTTGLHVGDVALHTLADRRLGEVGYTLAVDARGRGFAVEAVGAVIDFAFRVLQMHRITASLDAENRASAAVCERIGMRREGLMIACGWYHERWCDEYLYAVLEHEWQVRHPVPLFREGCHTPPHG